MDRRLVATLALVVVLTTCDRHKPRSHAPAEGEGAATPTTGAPGARLEIAAFPTRLSSPAPLPAVVARDGHEVTWSVTPPNVAAIQGDQVVPLAEGAATLVASSAGASATRAFDVVLPRSLFIDCYGRGPASVFDFRQGCVFRRGERFTLHVFSLSAGKLVLDKDVKATWQLAGSFVTPLGGDEFLAAAEGRTTLTATAGALTVTERFDVLPPLSKLQLRCGTEETIEATPDRNAVRARSACAIRVPKGMQGAYGAPLSVRIFDDRGAPSEAAVDWQSSDARVVAYSADSGFAYAAGKADLTARVGSMSATFPVEIEEIVPTEQKCGDLGAPWLEEAFVHLDHGHFETAWVKYACRDAQAVACVKAWEGGRLPGVRPVEQMAAAASCCCNEKQRGDGEAPDEFDARCAGRGAATRRVDFRGFIGNDGNEVTLSARCPDTEGETCVRRKVDGIRFVRGIGFDVRGEVAARARECCRAAP